MFLLYISIHLWDAFSGKISKQDLAFAFDFPFIYHNRTNVFHEVNFIRQRVNVSVLKLINFYFIVFGYEVL